ncbi:MAG: hypothetical protein ACRDI2_11870 [Chloroflexota bacterium]
MTSRDDRNYTTVNPQGSPNYVAPHEPTCPPTHRYMAVHRVVGGGWGIVDRRTGRLLTEARPDQHRYPGWQDVQTAVRSLNLPQSG